MNPACALRGMRPTGAIQLQPRAKRSESPGSRSSPMDEALKGRANVRAAEQIPSVGRERRLASEGTGIDREQCGTIVGLWPRCRWLLGKRTG
jgi:hypothetical protein